MSLRVSARLFLAGLAVFPPTVASRAQSAPPTTYTLVENFSLMGPTSVMKYYRNGSKVVLDTKSDTAHNRSLIDLDNHQSVGWDENDATAACGRSEFRGDWGDPFTMSAGFIDELKKMNAKQLPSETMLGVKAEVWAASSPDGDGKAWIDAAHSLILKYQLTPKTGPAKVLIEVTGVTYVPPPASVFIEPKRCASTPAPVHVPTTEERIAAETGDDAANYASGTYGPGSADSCNVSLRVVAAKTMQPVAIPYQVAIDLTYDPEQKPPPHYTIGLSQDGHSTFEGAGMHELTSQIKNGVLRIDNFPPQIDIELIFHDGGGASGLVYRHCFGPHTELLYVLPDPEHDNTAGEFLWVKAGKYASH
jgi:hypothetical protein